MPRVALTTDVPLHSREQFTAIRATLTAYPASTRDPRPSTPLSSPLARSSRNAVKRGIRWPYACSRRRGAS